MTSEQLGRGAYIVIEGPEGVGKTTQVEMLARRFTELGYPVRQFREPDSQSDLTARAIRMLTQDPSYPMSTRTEVLLYNAARSQSLGIIREARNKGVICICDRNYLTTLAIQYYGRGDVPDYDTINSIINFAVGDMQPDVTIVMDAPAPILQERTRGRGQGERFDNLDLEFLERVRAGYLWEAKQRGFPIIFATTSIEEIHESIWKAVHNQPHNGKQLSSVEPPVALTAPAPKESETKVEPIQKILEDMKEHLTEPKELTYLTKDEKGNYQMTSDGKDFLSRAVTSAEGDVYAFSDQLSPVTIAAAMARLSRRADDMRITILDEFAGKLGKDEKLLQRVITAYGDDSVQQLAGVHFVIENASNILTKKLEWGRLAAYLEQSTRYIYFDQKDSLGKYKYFTPEYLDKKTKAIYEKQMDAIFDIYSNIVHKLTDHVENTSKTPKKERDVAWRSAVKAQACDAARPLLPVAVKSTVGIFASGQALESLIMHLLGDDLKEAREVGESLLREARKVVPVFLERADKPDRGGATIAYNANTRKKVRELAKGLLPDNYSAAEEPVQLTDVWPRSEFDLVPDMLYEHSNLSLKDLRKEVNKWPYEKKLQVFEVYMGERLNRRHRPGRALEKAHYSWDLVCDYGIFRDLQRHRMVDDLNWQLLTPRYGYDTPDLIDEANLNDDFERGFGLSLELYDQLIKAGYPLEAQYATLLGHKMRWKMTYNAREAMHFNELRTSPQGHPGYRKLVKQMHEKLCEVHPLLGEAMRFVNQGEDVELTRLAAERYTQFKLSQLEEPRPETPQKT